MLPRSPPGSARPQTRRTYTAVYRSLVAFLGEHAVVSDLTPEAVRAYRDALEHADRTPATIAKRLSAIRALAAAVGAHADVRKVKSEAWRAASPELRWPAALNCAPWALQSAELEVARSTSIDVLPITVAAASMRAGAPSH